MKLKTVTYSALGNMGNYQNERIELSAELEEGETYTEVLEKLKKGVHAKLKSQDEYWETCKKFDQANKDLKAILAKLEAAKKNWELVSEFLKAQGIKTDSAEFPTLAALPEAVEGELVETDDIPF